MSDVVKTASAHLFGDGAANVFAILDGASVPGLLDKLSALKPEYVCLYRGELKPDLAEVAPYLVRVEDGSELAEWILGQGWGKHWGVFALSKSDLHAMRQHFRRFLVVYDDAGKSMYFRYYDPRVLRTYLPTCTAGELASVFGPVESYVLEDENAAVLLRFQCASGALAAHKERLAPE